jgi:hypothetical protein
MKIKVYESGETEFTADDEYTEPGLRHALGLEADRDEEVRAVIYETTDGMRDCEHDEYLVITEDDGSPLWSGWLGSELDGKPAPAEVASSEDLPAPAADGTGWAQGHARRYLTAVYGPDYVFAAPETFSNMLERWVWAVGAGAPELAETCMAAIEQHFAARQGGE